MPVPTNVEHEVTQEDGRPILHVWVDLSQRHGPTTDTLEKAEKGESKYVSRIATTHGVIYIHDASFKGKMRPERFSINVTIEEPSPREVLEVLLTEALAKKDLFPLNEIAGAILEALQGFVARLRRLVRGP